MSLSRSKKVSQLEINNLTSQMTMDQIRATKTFQEMPTRFFVHGRAIPKSALRRDDLARFYLSAGGEVLNQPKKELKHYRAPVHKKTSLEKKHDQYKRSLTKDHRGASVSRLHHQPSKSSLKRPMTFRFQNKPAAKKTDNPSSDDTDDLTDDLMMWNLTSKRQKDVLSDPDDDF